MRLDPGAWLDRTGVRRLVDVLGAGNVRFVGGVVRDLALGLEPGDLDLATKLAPDEVVERLETARIKAIPTGIAHGTVTAVSSGTVVEVTSLRADVETDGRRAIVAFTDDWRADAARRDFTINALYADPLSGEVEDYFDGLADLADRRVRFIGEPLVRIAEDHLRILRFFRFHARFAAGGSAPDQPSLAACAARANDLMALSRERIADELLKLLALPDPSATLAMMRDHRILDPVLPEILVDGAERVAALVLAETAAAVPADPLRRLAALLPSDAVIADKVAARLKLSNKFRKRLALAATPLLPGDPHALAYWIGVDSAIDQLLLDGQPSDAARIADWNPPSLPIGGGALIARGVSQGPEVARTLQAIERAWVAASFVSGEEFERLVGRALASR